MGIGDRYQGADLDPVDGYLVVRQGSSHAWAEYGERGRGWVRADPTAAVAPDRIVRSRRLQPAPGIPVSPNCAPVRYRSSSTPMRHIAGTRGSTP